MYEKLQELIAQVGFTTNELLLAGIALGTIIVVAGLSGAMAGASPQTRRLHATPGHNYRPSEDFDLVRGDDNDPNGFLKAFVPSSRKERTAIGRRLRMAGIKRKDAVANYYITRALLGIGLPAAFLGLRYMPGTLLGDLGAPAMIAGTTWLLAVQIVAVLALVGFYAPVAWLAYRIHRRRRKIWESFPNALDLLQVAIEAGMGFDAAIVRVSHELSTVAPAIAEEFMRPELEIQAGNDRNKAFADMAERTGVEEVKAFTNVMLQAAQFGTSVSSALNTYATEMRVDRELKAQEKAKRLPVQMSGVIAICMMPVLLMICLSPMVIR